MNRNRIKMPPSRTNVKCFQCKCTESLMWKQIGSNQQLCHTCFEANKNELESISAAKTDAKKGFSRRKSTRCTRNTMKNIIATTTVTSQPSATNSKVTANRVNTRGRRNLNRRAPIKAPTTTATTTNVTSLFHKVRASLTFSFSNIEQSIQVRTFPFFFPRARTFKSATSFHSRTPITIHSTHRSVD